MSASPRLPIIFFGIVFFTQVLGAEVKREPLASAEVVERFDTCMANAATSGTDTTTSSHYCACLVDFEREHTIRVGGTPARIETVSAERKCVRFAFNQPKRGFGAVAASSSEPAELGTASIVTQVNKCVAGANDHASCVCGADKSRAQYKLVGAKALTAELGTSGFAIPAAALCVDRQP